MHLLNRIFYAVRFTALTSNFSFTYLCLFLPAALLAYTLTPNRWKKWMLLAESYSFFFLISNFLTGFLLVSTASVYGLGLWLDALGKRCKAEVRAAEKEQKKAIKKKYATAGKWVVFLGLVLNLGILLWLKYSGFLAENVNLVCSWLGLDWELAVPRYVMPIGISFYTLAALSYLLDIQRGVLTADRNFGRVALFVSFFPGIVEGPICRYSQTAQQLWDAKPIRYENLKLGCQRILYGMMKKMVVADRLNPFVTDVFGDFSSYGGGYIALAAVAYTAQLYMDFSGAMDCVLGTAQIFGISVPENFNSPFFSRTISEFWSRWHVSLGTWFKDYIFYPVTMSKPMKNLTVSARKKLGNHFGPLIAGSVALFCVWFCNGLWHGNEWHYIGFGMYHLVLILIGNFTAPYSQQLKGRLGITKESRGFALFQRLRTAFLVVIGELIFRAESMADAFGMMGRMLRDLSFTGEFSVPAVDSKDVLITLVTLGIVLTVSVLRERGVSVRDWAAGKPRALRWALWCGLILYIFLFGAYGKHYMPVDPMYANF